MIINHIHTYGTVCHAIMFLLTLYFKFIKPKNTSLNFNNLVILFFLLGHLVISIFLGVINVYSDNQKFYVMGIIGHLFLFIHMALHFLNTYVFKTSKNKKLDYHFAINILFILSQVVMILRYSYFKKDVKNEKDNNDNDNDKENEKNKGIKLTPLIMLSLFYLLHLFVNKNNIMKFICIRLSFFYLLLFIAEYQS